MNVARTGILAILLSFLPSASAQTAYSLRGELDYVTVVAIATPGIPWTTTKDTLAKHIFMVMATCFACEDIGIEADQTVQVGIESGTPCPTPVTTWYYGGLGANAAGVGYVYAQTQGGVSSIAGSWWQEEDCNENVYESDPPGGNYFCGYVN